MRGAWFHESVSSIQGSNPAPDWAQLPGLPIGLFAACQRRVARRRRELRDRIRQGRPAISLAARKNTKHPRMLGHSGEVLREPEDDSWKRRR